MTPSDFVPTIETCKELEELGISFNSYFIWRVYKDGKCNVVSRTFLGEPCNRIYSAPTVQELLNKMPDKIERKFEECTFTINQASDYYYVWYGPNDMHNKNLAEALAQMLIWLIRKKYI